MQENQTRNNNRNLLNINKFAYQQIQSVVHHTKQCITIEKILHLSAALNEYLQVALEDARRGTKEYHTYHSAPPDSVDTWTSCGECRTFLELLGSLEESGKTAYLRTTTASDNGEQIKVEINECVQRFLDEHKFTFPYLDQLLFIVAAAIRVSLIFHLHVETEANNLGEFLLKFEEILQQVCRFHQVRESGKFDLALIQQDYRNECEYLVRDDSLSNDSDLRRKLVEKANLLRTHRWSAHDGAELDRLMQGTQRELMKRHKFLNMNKNTRGAGFFISNCVFKRHKHVYGNRADVRVMEAIWKKYHYDITVHFDLTDKEMIVAIDEFIQTLHPDVRIVFFCISSHGNEKLIYGINSEGVKRETILRMITKSNALARTHVMLMYGACSGQEVDKGVLRNGERVPTGSNIISFDAGFYGYKSFGHSSPTVPSRLFAAFRGACTTLTSDPSRRGQQIFNVDEIAYHVKKNMLATNESYCDYVRVENNALQPLKIFPSLPFEDIQLDEDAESMPDSGHPTTGVEIRVSREVLRVELTSSSTREKFPHVLQDEEPHTWRAHIQSKIQTNVFEREELDETNITAELVTLRNENEAFKREVAQLKLEIEQQKQIPITTTSSDAAATLVSLLVSDH